MQRTFRAAGLATGQPIPVEPRPPPRVQVAGPPPPDLSPLEDPDALAKAADPATPGPWLALCLEAVRRVILSADYLPEERERHYALARAIAQNPNAPVKVLRQIVGQPGVLGSMCFDEGARLVRENRAWDWACLEDPALTDEIDEKLARYSENPEEVAALCRSRNRLVGGNALGREPLTPAEAIRAAVPEAPLDVLAMAVDDLTYRDSPVLLSALVDRMLADDSPETYKALYEAICNCSPTDARRLYARAMVWRDRHLAYKGNAPDTRALNCWQTITDRLVWSEAEPCIKRDLYETTGHAEALAVASHTPPDLLALLSQHPDPRTRERALSHHAGRPLLPGLLPRWQHAALLDVRLYADTCRLWLRHPAAEVRRAAAFELVNDRVRGDQRSPPLGKRFLRAVERPLPRYLPARPDVRAVMAEVPGSPLKPTALWRMQPSRYRKRTITAAPAGG